MLIDFSSLQVNKIYLKMVILWKTYKCEFLPKSVVYVLANTFLETNYIACETLKNTENIS
jgi:uncharacterized membrane protein YukC